MDIFAQIRPLTAISNHKPTNLSRKKKKEKKKLLFTD